MSCFTGDRLNQSKCLNESNKQRFNVNVDDGKKQCQYMNFVFWREKLCLIIAFHEDVM